MGCDSCRKPKVIRKPNQPSPTTGTIAAQNSNNQGSDQRGRITGLTYVPKK